jgi:hypothetical protein
MKLFTMVPSIIGTSLIHCATCNARSTFNLAVRNGWKGYTMHPFTYACNTCAPMVDELHTNCDACDKADKQ